MQESTNRIQLSAKLLANGLRYRVRKTLNMPGPVEALSLEITHRCICRCSMCNIWKISPKAPELSIPTWAGVLADPCFGQLRELDITGGEPFLKDALPDLFAAIRKWHRSHLHRLRSIAITTNAILTTRVLQMTRVILEELQGTGIQLVLVCAMDALDTLHDRIRNYPGAYRKLQATLAGLFQLRVRFPHLILGIKTTVLPVNIECLPGIQAFCRQNDLFAIISPCIVTAGRYLNREYADELRFSPVQIGRLAAFFSRKDLEWRYHAQTLRRFFIHGRVKKRCSCGLNYAFIRSSGEVHLCPLLAGSAGNVSDRTFQRVWTSATARRLRRRVGASSECRRCTEPGIERYALCYEGWGYLMFLLREGRGGLGRFHSHMGLDHFLK
jgi:MoaA/NifB/PqqE/SkfB family radical SAM enzyme